MRFGILTAVAGCLPLVLNHGLWAAETTAAAVSAQPVVLNLTLNGALTAAADSNPDVQLYKERIEAAQEQVQTQLGSLLPNLAGTVRQTRQTQFLGTFGLAPQRTDPFSIFDGRVNASHNLFSVSLIQRWRASRESLHVTEFESDSRKYDVMASAALAYMEGLKAMAMVKMHEGNQRVMEDLLVLVKQRQRGGVATGLDIARLEAQIANERQITSSSRYDVEHSLYTLLNAMAIPYDIKLSLTDDLKSDVGEIPSSHSAIESALGARPEVQAQFTRVKASELIYSSITGERIPSLVAQGDYGLIGNRWTNTLDTYNVAVLLQIPLFDGGQREGRIAEARSQLRQEAFRMRSVLNQVKMEVHDALAALGAAKEQVGIARHGLQSATKEFDLAKERFTVITAAGYFELTNGLNSVAKARENLVNALFQLNAARVNFARSIGSLSALN